MGLMVHSAVSGARFLAVNTVGTPAGMVTGVTGVTVAWRCLAAVAPPRGGPRSPLRSTAAGAMQAPAVPLPAHAHALPASVAAALWCV